MTDSNSRTVQERYLAFERIGEGGMAIIEAAKDRSLNRTVAVKRLKLDHAESEDKKKRFFQEAYVLAGLSHPGILPIYDIGEEDGLPYYAMKRIEGRTLRAFLKDRIDDSVRDAAHMFESLYIFERIAEAVAYAHSKGIVHRDLKPENVMIDLYGTVFVMDWGLAKRLDSSAGVELGSQTEDGRMMGSPAYMSPEQASGKAMNATPGTDVFALGIMLYELLTNARPFRGDSFDELFDKIKTTTPPSPRSLNPTVSRELSAICLKALSKNPAERYQDAGELAKDVANARAFLPVTAVQTTILDSVFNWGRRERTKASVILTAVFIGLFVVGALTMSSYQKIALERRVERMIMDSEVELAGINAQRSRAQKEGAAQRQLHLQALVERLFYVIKLMAFAGITSGDGPVDEVMEKYKEQMIGLVEEANRVGKHDLAIAIGESILKRDKTAEYAALTDEEKLRLREIIKRAQGQG